MCALALAIFALSLFKDVDERPSALNTQLEPNATNTSRETHLFLPPRIIQRMPTPSLSRMSTCTPTMLPLPLGIPINARAPKPIGEPKVIERAGVKGRDVDALFGRLHHEVLD